MKVNQAQYDALPEELKKNFKQVEGKDEYDNGEENAAAIRVARDKERDIAKDRQAKLDALQKEHDELKDAHAKRVGKDETEQQKIDALEKSWKEKLEKQTGELTGKLSQREKALQDLLVGNTAKDLAAAISTQPHLIEHFIKQRLQAEYDGDKPSTRVLDVNGQPTALTIDELKAEFLADTRFSSILIGSNASGGGAGRGGVGGGAFDFKSYKNADGSVNWAKVHMDSQKNPQLVSQVQSALADPAAGQTA